MKGLDPMSLHIDLKEGKNDILSVTEREPNLEPDDLDWKVELSHLFVA